MAASLVFNSGSSLSRYQTLVTGTPTILYYILLEDVAWQSHDQSMNKLGLVDSPQHVVNFCVFIHVIDMARIFMFSPVIQVLCH